MAQTARAAAAVCPCEGKNIPIGNPPHAASSIQLARRGSSSVPGEYSEDLVGGLDARMGSALDLLGGAVGEPPLYQDEP